MRALFGQRPLSSLPGQRTNVRVFFRAGARARFRCKNAGALRDQEMTDRPGRIYAPARRLTTSLNCAVSVNWLKLATLPSLNRNTCTNWAFTLAPVAL